MHATTIINNHVNSIVRASERRSAIAARRKLRMSGEIQRVTAERAAMRAAIEADILAEEEAMREGEILVSPFALNGDPDVEHFGNPLVPLA